MPKYLKLLSAKQPSIQAYSSCSNMHGSLLPINFIFLALAGMICACSCNLIVEDDPNRDDGPNKKQYGCGCHSNGAKIFFEKPFKATVNADKVIVRWHPFSRKVIRVANKGDNVIINAKLDYHLDAFVMLNRDTFAICKGDTIQIHKGRRASAIWEDTIRGTIKIRMRTDDLSKDDTYRDRDSNSFKIVLKKEDVELLPNSVWYYLDTPDGSDACIIEKYLDFDPNNLTEKIGEGQ